MPGRSPFRRTTSRIILPFAATLAVAAIVFGCKHSAAPDELRIALAVFPGEAAQYQAFVADFERREHVHLRILAQTYSDILQVLRVQARARRGGLDLVELDLAMLGEAAENVSDLDSAIPANARPLFPEAAWQAGSPGGHLKFAPHRLMWQAMIYNRVEVPNPPQSWGELGRFAHEHPGKLAIKAARYEGAICDVMPFVWASGGGMCTPDSSGSIRGLGFLGGIAPLMNPESAVLREMSVLEAQARGSVWIHFNWPFAIGYLHSKGLAPAVDMSAPIPAGPDGRQTVLGGGYLGIPVSATHRELAEKFIAYLLDRNVQRELSRRLGWYGSVAPEPGSEEATLYSGYTLMRPYVRPRPEVDCYTRLSNEWQRAIRSVLIDRQPTDTTLLALASDLGVRPDARSEELRCGCTDLRK